jgi:hypothetical protein
MPAPSTANEWSLSQASAGVRGPSCTRSSLLPSWHLRGSVWRWQAVDVRAAGNGEFPRSCRRPVLGVPDGVPSAMRRGPCREPSPGEYRARRSGNASSSNGLCSGSRPRGRGIERRHAMRAPAKVPDGEGVRKAVTPTGCCRGEHSVGCGAREESCQVSTCPRPVDFPCPAAAEHGARGRTWVVGRHRWCRPEDRLEMVRSPLVRRNLANPMVGSEMQQAREPARRANRRSRENRQGRKV